MIAPSVVPGQETACRSPRSNRHTQSAAGAVLRRCGGAFPSRRQAA